MTFGSSDHELLLCWNSSAADIHSGGTIGQPVILIEVYQGIKIYKRIPGIIVALIQPVGSSAVAALIGYGISQARIGHDIADFVGVRYQTHHTRLQLIISPGLVGLYNIDVIGIHARTHGTAYVALGLLELWFLCEHIQRGSQKLPVGGGLENLG